MNDRLKKKRKRQVSRPAALVKVDESGEPEYLNPIDHQVILPNPADPKKFLSNYNYLDDLSTAGLIWEFIRRDKKYEDFLWKHQNMNGKNRDQLMMEYRQNFSPMPLLSSSTRANKKLFTDKFYAPIALNLGTATEAVLNLIPRLIIEGNGNILMLLIDLTVPQNIDDLLKKIEREVRSRKKGLKFTRKGKVSEKGPIWKWYIIIYDLREVYKKKIKEISDFLSATDEQFTDEQKVRRYYREAKKLIDEGGYKLFLPFLSK